MSLCFELTPEQKQLGEDVAEVCQKFAYLIPECEKESKVPMPFLQEMGKHKWAGPMVPEKYGGMGKGAVEFAIITEAAARGGLFGFIGTAQTGKAILVAGTEEQKQKYLPGLASAEIINATVISEPEAGSSLDRMKTTAIKKNGRYILNGVKAHINFGAEAGLLVTYAKTDNGISTFLVPGATRGISFRKEDPICLRMEPIYTVYFEDCEVEASALLGKEGDALNIFKQGFNVSRMANASRAIGLARAALEEAIDYAKNRTVGKNKVTDFQGIRWMVAELYTRLEAVSLLRYKAAWLEDIGEEHALETSMAKLAAIEMLTEVTNNVYSLVGGWGCYREQPFELLWRESTAVRIGGGSMEVMKNIIARRILGKTTI